ncbi:hypothetical protein E4T66_20105 [Sinimarinibacterium sp. CAU 1509]|nr:hypothetical protein E4T66_20105 [Sinimarinibacterium sp. CAU 1509]
MQAVDALFVQGMRDTLVSLNHAWHGYRFLSQLGGDVRLLTHQHGHILPAPFSTNAALGSIACGGVDTIETIRAWMDAKLRGNAQVLAQIPEVCISLDDDGGVRLDQVPRGGAAVVSIPPTAVTSANSDLANGPVFVPLAAPIRGENFVLAGIPTASLKITSDLPGTAGVAFVAVGVKYGDAAPYPVDHQVRALRSDREHVDIELRGVGERLHDGGQVGVLIYGDFSEFEPEGQPVNFLANAFTIEGEVSLPVFSR